MVYEEGRGSSDLNLHLLFKLVGDGTLASGEAAAKGSLAAKAAVKAKALSTQAGDPEEGRQNSSVPVEDGGVEHGALKLESLRSIREESKESRAISRES